MYQRTTKAKLPDDHRGTPKSLAVTIVMLVLFLCTSALTAFGQRTRIDTGTTSAPSKPNGPSGRTPKYRARTRTPRPEGPRAAVSEDAVKFLKLGNEFFDAKKWHAAIAANTLALKLSPGNSEALAALALSRFNLGQYYISQANWESAKVEYLELKKLKSNLADDLVADLKSSEH